MSFPQPNPYASPVGVGPVVDSHGLPPDAVSKAEAIIKDAGQFWLAIIICLCCSGIGSLIIGPWYLVRLLQWNSLSSAYPYLQQPGPANSLATRFQGAKVKLIIGKCSGVVILGFYILLYVVAVANAAAAAGR